MAVLVDESAAGGVSSDRLAGPRLDDAAIVGCALAEGPVGPVRVVVLDVLAQELFQLLAIPYEGAIEELAAHGANPAFRIRIRDRGARWCADDRRAFGSEDLVERPDELAGAVADQKPDGSLVTHREVAGCLSRPGTGRVRRDASEMHAAAVEFDEEQHVVADAT